MEVSGKLHPPAALPQGRNSVSLKYEAFWGPKAGVDVSGNDKISDRDSNFGPSRPLTCHYID
jgi:hypothetical protein